MRHHEKQVKVRIKKLAQEVLQLEGTEGELGVQVRETKEPEKETPQARVYMRLETKMPSKNPKKQRHSEGPEK